MEKQDEAQPVEHGLRFSQLYLDRSKLVGDSVRFRNRLSAYFVPVHQRLQLAYGRAIELETGAKVGQLQIGEFFERAELRDVLDAITVIYDLTAVDYSGAHSQEWKDFVSRVLAEEDICYKLDPKAGVHFRVDEEFERNRISTILALTDQKNANILDAFESAFRHLNKPPQDTKAAVRSIFEAVEILVKRMVITRNLNSHIVKNKLKDYCFANWDGDQTARKVADGLFSGFADWVDSIHNYRHGQDAEGPVNPPLDIAVYVVSTGSALLRWLLDLEANILDQNPTA